MANDPKHPLGAIVHCILHHRRSFVALRILDTRLVPSNLLDEPQPTSRPADDARQHARDGRHLRERVIWLAGRPYRQEV